MSQMLLSAYTGLAKLLAEANHLISPAELQGILLGRTCAGVDLSQDCLADISIFLQEGELTEEIKQAILGLQAMTQQELSSDAMAVTLLLPADDEPLKERINALVEWGQGFLAGFGLVKQEETLSQECLEILQDIASITVLDAEIATEDQASSENDYMEVVEYLRVAPVLLYITFVKSQPNQTISNKIIH